MNGERLIGIGAGAFILVELIILGLMVVGMGDSYFWINLFLSLFTGVFFCVGIIIAVGLMSGRLK